MESAPPTAPTIRLPFIDFARGLVMVIMAWDHVSGFWNPGHRGGEGLQGDFPTFPDFTQFMLRFVTHWAAPTFIFLTGVSMALSAHRRLARGDSERAITVHLLKRGAVLMLLAIFLESAAFGLPPLYFGVISCIGLSLIIMSFARRLPVWVIVVLSLAIILLHPFLNLDWIPGGPIHPWGHYLRGIIHEASLDVFPFFVLYPILPWLGVMGLGWAFGKVLLDTDPKALEPAPEADPQMRRRFLMLLAGIGVALLAGWFVVRLLNGYGNLVMRDGNDLQSWLSMSKYPPDLAFLLWGLSGTFLFMALGFALEGQVWFSRGVTGILLDLGRAALFFYITHLWFYRITPFFGQGEFTPPLIAVVVWWVIGILVLWRLGLRWERYKHEHPDSLAQYI